MSKASTKTNEGLNRMEHLINLLHGAVALLALWALWACVRIIVFLVTMPPGTLTDAMASADDEEDDSRWSTLRQRERYRDLRR